MNFLTDRRNLLLLAGAAVALVSGVLIAKLLAGPGEGDATAPPPASQGGLVIDPTASDEPGLDPARVLRCFVAGKFVGDLVLAECAKRNGVATDALDVGMDETGALAAANQPGALLAPLPPPDAAIAAVATPAAPPAVTATVAPAGACWRHAGGQWSRLPTDLTLDACVQTLFAGRCEKQGRASYGRWLQQSLRLVSGKVEISADNHSFRTLVEQGRGCAIPPVG